MVVLLLLTMLLLPLQEPDATDYEPVPSTSASDKPLLRLFVGWVPKLFTERDLLPLFQKVCCAARELC